MRVVLAMGVFSAVVLQAATPLPRIARAIASNEPRLEGDVLFEDAEVEFDDGSRVRPWNDTDPWLVDHLQLSTGQRITHLRLDRGDLSLDVNPSWRDSFTVTVPGAQFQFLGPARARVQTWEDGSIRACVFAGEIAFYTRSVDLRVPRGKCLNGSRATPDRFSFEHEVDAAQDWIAARVDELAANGKWISTDDGLWWKPEAPAGWTPYRDGAWKWIERLGWTFVPVEAWGWRTTHYGRWVRSEQHGWLWRETEPAFVPAAAFWMTGAGFAAWGPLAPGESWPSADLPRAFAQAHLTLAEWKPGMRKVDPKGFAAPVKDLLAALLPAENPAVYGPRFAARETVDGLVRFGIAPREPEHTPPPKQPPRERTTPVTRSLPPPGQPTPEFVIGPTMIVPVAYVEQLVTVEADTTTYLAPDYRGIVVYDPPVSLPRKRR